MMRRISLLVVFALLAAMVSVISLAAPAMLDGDFEAGTASWTINNKAGDKRVCVGDNNAEAFNGSCSFLMKGNTDSRVVLKNTATAGYIDTVNAGTVGGDYALTFGLYRLSTSALTKMTVKFIVVLDDDSRVTQKVVSSGITGLLRAEWVEVVGPVLIVPQGSTAVNAKLKILDKSNAGKQWIDDVEIGID
jgi:hypothetical protein